MATSNRGNGPAPLDPKVIKKLLSLLSTDNEFRRLFKKDAHEALRQAGYKAPVATGERATASAMASPGACLQMKSSDSIAPKANLVRDRAKLEECLSVPFGFICPAVLKA